MSLHAASKHSLNQQRNRHRPPLAQNSLLSVTSNRNTGTAPAEPHTRRVWESVPIHSLGNVRDWDPDGMRVQIPQSAKWFHC